MSGLPSQSLWGALASPQRRAILRLLGAHGEMTVNDLAEVLDLSQPSTSQHLAELRDVGLVEYRAEVSRRFYRLDLDGMRLAKQQLDGFMDLLEAR